MEEKPTGQEAGWQRLETEFPYTCPAFRLRRDRLRLKNGTEVDFTYVQSRGAIWVVPVTPQREVVLIRQYRYAVDEWVWEVPAGGMFDHDGDLESLVRRELAEEVGGESDRLQYLGYFFGGAATSDVRCHVYIAHDTLLNRKPEPEAMEDIEVHVVSIDKALRMSRSGEMRDGRSALALLWSEPHLRELIRYPGF